MSPSSLTLPVFSYFSSEIGGTYRCAEKEGRTITKEPNTISSEDFINYMMLKQFKVNPSLLSLPSLSPLSPLSLPSPPPSSPSAPTLLSLLIFSLRRHSLSSLPCAALLPLTLLFILSFCSVVTLYPLPSPTNLLFHRLKMYVHPSSPFSLSPLFLSSSPLPSLILSSFFCSSLHFRCCHVCSR